MNNKEQTKKLSHAQVASLGGIAQKVKYPIEVRREWRIKAARARWDKKIIT
jgi:hypothetical protein